MERFFWILVTTALADCILFKFLDAVALDVFVSLISLVLLIGCAAWLEAPFVGVYLDRMFTKLLRDAGNHRDSDEEES